MNIEKYFLALSTVNSNRAFNLIMEEDLSIIEVEVLLKVKHEEAKKAVLTLKEAGLIIENTGKTEIYVRFKTSEKFVKDNKPLYDYLRNSYKKDEQFQKDIKRLRIFKEKDVILEEILSNKDEVKKLLDRK